MFREYENQKIYKDFKIAKILSLISLILAIITFLTFTIAEYAVMKTAFRVEHIVFFLFLLLIPFTLFTTVRKAEIVQPILETKWLNDISYISFHIVFSFIDIVYVIFMMLIGTLSKSVWEAALLYAYFLGYSFVSHIFSYLSAFILIHALILIKKEWKTNPPQFYAKKLKIVKEKKEAVQKEISLNKCNELLEKCGMRFFIKYLKQIQKLPLRDVIVEENYSPSEREERLCAAKEIVDLQLDAMALNQIIKNYSSALKPEEIEMAQTLLRDIQSK